MPDPLFHKLFEETAQTRWQPVSDLRDHARRRARRARAALVAAAAAAVVAASAGIAVAQLDSAPAPAISGPPSTPPPPTASPSPSTPPPSTAPPSTPPPTATAPADGGRLTAALFLQPEDVGPGYRSSGVDTEPGDGTFEYSASALDCPLAERPVRPLDSAYSALSRGTPEAEDLVAEAVHRYGPGDAARYLAEVRARVAACDPGGGGRDISIVARDFAGQGALLVYVDYGYGDTTHHVLVRQGDLLAQFFVKPDLDRPALRALGRAAAARLCAGTDAC
jgi:hypothetical protein